MSAIQLRSSTRDLTGDGNITGFEVPIDVKTAARFLGVSPSLSVCLR